MAEASVIINFVATGAQKAGDSVKKIREKLGQLKDGASRLAGRLKESGTSVAKFANILVTAGAAVGTFVSALAATALSMGLAVLAGGITGLTGLLAKLGREAVATGTIFDDFRIKFRTLYGSIDLASEKMRVAIDYAAQTPFRVNQVVDAFAAFQAVGIDPTQVRNQKMLLDDMADLAFGMGKSLQDAYWSVKEAAAEGNWMSLMRRFSTSKQQIQSLLEARGFEVNLGTIQGRIDAIREYIQIRFGGSMEAMSGSVRVLLSNIGDHWMKFKDLVYQSGLSESIADIVTRILEKLDELWETGQMESWAQSLGDVYRMIHAGILQFVEVAKAAYDDILSRVRIFGGASSEAILLAVQAAKVFVQYIAVTIKAVLALTKTVQALGSLIWGLVGGVTGLSGAFTFVGKVAEKITREDTGLGKVSKALDAWNNSIDAARAGLGKTPGDIAGTSKTADSLNAVFEESVRIIDDLKGELSESDSLVEGIKRGIELIRNAALGAAGAVGEMADETERLRGANRAVELITDRIVKAAIDAKRNVIAQQKEVEKLKNQYAGLLDKQFQINEAAAKLNRSYGILTGTLTKPAARLQEIAEIEKRAARYRAEGMTEKALDQQRKAATERMGFARDYRMLMAQTGLVRQVEGELVDPLKGKALFEAQRKLRMMTVESSRELGLSPRAGAQEVYRAMEQKLGVDIQTVSQETRSLAEKFGASMVDTQQRLEKAIKMYADNVAGMNEAMINLELTRQAIEQSGLDITKFMAENVVRKLEEAATSLNTIAGKMGLEIPAAVGAMPEDLPRGIRGVQQASAAVLGPRGGVPMTLFEMSVAAEAEARKQTTLLAEQKKVQEDMRDEARKPLTPRRRDDLEVVSPGISVWM